METTDSTVPQNLTKDMNYPGRQTTPREYGWVVQPN
jgi:hypothetical protein